jgi:hypothetical protein
MSSNPLQSAAFAHRYLVWLRNSILSTSGSTNDIVADRVQSVEPTATHATTKYQELGRVGYIGATNDPTQMKVVLEENLHNSEIDMYLAGVASSGSGMYVSNYVGQINTAFVVQRNDTDTVIGEIGVGNLRLSEVQYRFVMNGACTAQYTLEGTSGSYYTTPGTFVHPTWGTLDSAAVSAGGIHGKDARIFFGSPGAANKGYRLQSFTVRAALPVTHVKELGTRQEVGVLNDVPDVTVDFDLLTADAQPNDIFFGSSSDGGSAHLNLTDPQTLDIFINVYDPAMAEGASVVKSFRIDNCRPTSNTPIQARVRQLSTSRWTLQSTSEDTAGSGGLTISKTEILA